MSVHWTGLILHNNITLQTFCTKHFYFVDRCTYTKRKISNLRVTTAVKNRCLVLLGTFLKIWQFSTHKKNLIKDSNCSSPPPFYVTSSSWSFTSVEQLRTFRPCFPSPFQNSAIFWTNNSFFGYIIVLEAVTFWTVIFSSYPVPICGHVLVTLTLWNSCTCNSFCQLYFPLSFTNAVDDDIRIYVSNWLAHVYVSSSVSKLA